MKTADLYLILFFIVSAIGYPFIALIFVGLWVYDYCQFTEKEIQERDDERNDERNDESKYNYWELPPIGSQPLSYIEDDEGEDYEITEQETRDEPMPKKIAVTGEGQNASITYSEINADDEVLTVDSEYSAIHADDDLIIPRSMEEMRKEAQQKQKMKEFWLSADKRMEAHERDDIIKYRNMKDKKSH